MSNSRFKPQQREIDTEGDLASLIWAVATASHDPLYAIKELGKNSVDAEATWISIVRVPGMLIFIDNGFGIFPRIRRQDEQLVEEYDQADARTRASLYDRVWMSLNSLEHIQTNIANSPKRGRGLSGERALGLLSVYNIGRIIRIKSVVDPRFIPGYGVRGVKPGQAWELMPPTFYQLNGIDPITKKEYDSKGNRVQKSIRASLSELPEPLLDAKGAILTHGTRIEISEIDPDDEQKLSIGEIVRHIRNKFSPEIRSGVVFEVIDAGLSEATRIKPEVRRVEPRSFDGIPLHIPETFTVDGIPCSIRLKFDPNRRESAISVLKRTPIPGSDRKRIEEASLITQWPELNRDPFNTPQLVGEIEAPVWPANRPDRSSTLVWALNKEQLVGTARTLFVQAVLALAPVISQEVKRIMGEYKQQDVGTLGESLKEATALAMREVPFLSNTSFSQFQEQKRQVLGKKISTKGSATSQIRPGEVSAVVLTTSANGGLPIPGITIELWQQGYPSPIDRRVTGKSGSIIFGRYGFGKPMSLKLLPPEGSRVIDENPINFELTNAESLSTFRGEFRLDGIKITREKPPDFSNWNPVFTVFDTDDPWQELLHNKQIKFNIGVEPLASALREDRWADIANLLSEYTAAAITSYFLRTQSDVNYVLIQSSILFGKLRTHFSRVLEEKRRSKAQIAARRK